MVQSRDEFLEGSSYPRQVHWLWDLIVEEPELRQQIRDAFEEQARDPNRQVKWNQLIAQVWGRMADADITLVEDFPMVAMHMLVPWVAGGAMMHLMATTGEAV